MDEQGRRWILYELEFGNPDNRDPGKTTSVVIRVDPRRMLPDSMTFTRGDEKWQMTIDYPDEGPADIYALGVPRDTPVDDRMPPPDLDRILKIVQQNRRDFGDYLAVAGGDNRDRRFAVHLIRCKGDKCRVDVGLGDTKHVASGADMERWWREHGKDVLPEGSVLCDGRRVYQRTFVGPEAKWEPSNSPIQQGNGRAAAARIGRSESYFVDLKAYPQELSPEELASTPLLTVHLDPTGENGPAGSVRVERLFAEQSGPADRSTYHKTEFWLQPEYGYAVVQYAMSLSPAVDEDLLPKEKQLIWKYEGFLQTPSGVWYPTVVRWQNMVQSANKNEPRRIEFVDKVMYFYLDFAAELPDELFGPKWQGDLLGGITSAERDDQATANDLGKIRPPGGMPLICSRSVMTPEVMSRVSQRLEAALEKDLDKWVAELERIMDKKLDPWMDKQGCRTTFVTRMSVAFDGLKWNVKAADSHRGRPDDLRPGLGLSRRASLTVPASALAATGGAPLGRVRRLTGKPNGEFGSAAAGAWFLTLAFLLVGVLQTRSHVQAWGGADSSSQEESIAATDDDEASDLVSAYKGPCDLAASPDGKRLYVVENDARVLAVVSVAEGKVVRTIPLPGEPADAETAVRTAFRHNQFEAISEEKARAVDAYLRSLRPTPGPYLVDGALSESAERGRALFESTELGCATCHPMPLYTDLKMHDVTTRGSFDRRDTWDTPTLIECWRTGPYLHDGRYTTVKEVLATGNHGSAVKWSTDFR